MNTRLLVAGGALAALAVAAAACGARQPSADGDLWDQAQMLGKSDSEDAKLYTAVQNSTLTAGEGAYLLEGVRRVGAEQERDRAGLVEAGLQSRFDVLDYVKVMDAANKHLEGGYYVNTFMNFAERSHSDLEWTLQGINAGFQMADALGGNPAPAYGIPGDSLIEAKMEEAITVNGLGPSAT